MASHGEDYFMMIFGISVLVGIGYMFYTFYDEYVNDSDVLTIISKGIGLGFLAFIGTFFALLFPTLLLTS